jgi:hypothetical protein
MNIALGKAQTDWLQARVTDGTFAFLDEAVALIVAERMELEDDGLERAVPLLDAARRDVAGAGHSASTNTTRKMRNGLQPDDHAASLAGHSHSISATGSV